MNTENINIEDLIIGGTYNVRVKVFRVENGKRIITNTVGKKNEALTLCSTNFLKEELPAFSPVSPTPKYDPCRKFRKGDKVELKEEIDGRKLSEFVTGLTLGKIYTVEEDEKKHTVVIDSDNGLCRYSFVHLKLVTPVEERVPYSLFDNKKLAVWTVLKNELIFAYYPYRINESDNIVHSKKEALAAAEAECARLNAEHRKEQQ